MIVYLVLLVLMEGLRKVPAKRETAVTRRYTHWGRAPDNGGLYSSEGSYGPDSPDASPSADRYGKSQVV